MPTREKGQDYFTFGGKEFTDSCAPANVFIPDLKVAIGDDHSGDCCFHQESYKTLLAKYDDAQETISQMKRNLGIVTEQLVSRDQLYSAHMVRLNEVFLQLEEQLEDAHKQQSLRLVLEPRGALRRRPVSHINYLCSPVILIISVHPQPPWPAIRQ